MQANDIDALLIIRQYKMAKQSYEWSYQNHDCYSVSRYPANSLRLSDGIMN